MSRSLPVLELSIFRHPLSYNRIADSQFIRWGMHPSCQSIDKICVYESTVR